LKLKKRYSIIGGRFMKKTFGLFIILFTLILASCGGVSTASTLMVIEKGQSNNNNKEYWIKAYDPYNQKKMKHLR
jgi:hypothetical protein